MRESAAALSVTDREGGTPASVGLAAPGEGALRFLVETSGCKVGAVPLAGQKG